MTTTQRMRALLDTCRALNNMNAALVETNDALHDSVPTSLDVLLQQLRADNAQLNVSIADARYNVRTYELQRFCDAVQRNDRAALLFFRDSFNDNNAAR